MSKSPSLRRIQADVRELALDPSDRYYAAPLEDDMFEWHFTIRGADGTDFEGGVYHGRILLPPEYPFKPPHIVFLTPSGRFETGTKVCLSFSAFHPELWQPAWGIRLILEALISFLPTPADGAIGALDWTSEERKRLAKKSLDYCCPRCGKPESLLPKLKQDGEKKPSARFQKEIEQLQLLQIQNETKNDGEQQQDGAAAAKAEPEQKVKSEQKAEEKEVETNKAAEEEAETKPEAKTNGNQTVEQIPLTRPNYGATQRNPPRAEQAPAPVQAATAPPAVAAPAPTEDAQTDSTTMEVSWLSDPALHAIIILLVLLCVLLVRKSLLLAQELSSLRYDDEF